MAGTVGSDLYFLSLIVSSSVVRDVSQSVDQFQQSNSTQYGGAITPQIPVRGIYMSFAIAMWGSICFSLQLLYIEVSPGARYFKKSGRRLSGFIVSGGCLAINITYAIHSVCRQCQILSISVLGKLYRGCLKEQKKGRE